MGNLALTTIAEAAAEYGPRFVAPDVLLLESLGLSLRVQPDGPDANTGLYIGLFEASAEGLPSGIRVTCVSLPPDG